MTRISIILLILICISGCDGVAPLNTNAEPTPPQRSSEEDGSDLSPLSPNVTYAVDWTQVNISANSATTQVGIGAHFSTSRNACGKEAYGPISLEDWNQLATQVNAAIKARPSLIDYCVNIPEDNLYLNRTGLTVEVKADRGTRTLYEIKDGQICSTIKDHQISDGLLKIISNVITAADKEDCPNGWGS